MSHPNLNQVISTILKHDRKVNTYKFALLRSINDVALSYPDIGYSTAPIAIPLRMLAEFWLAYYWPFMDSVSPIMQGPRANRSSGLSNDMAFRELLTEFRQRWEAEWGGLSNPADGFVAINELRLQRRQQDFSQELHTAYEKTISKIASAIRQPIQYAGEGEWSVFPKPEHFSNIDHAVAVPGTRLSDTCLVVSADLWNAFRDLSLWIEALCIHEWCQFVGGVEQIDGSSLDRGVVYNLLTERPDNRRPLTWERNQIDLLLMEDAVFQCPWTEKRIKYGVAYDLDHLVPVSVYPINELWNLVPSDPHFNSHVKRDRMPSQSKLLQAHPHLINTYSNYMESVDLHRALEDDFAIRFSLSRQGDLPELIAKSTVNFIQSIAEARNLAQF